MRHLPTNGGGPAVTAVLGGNVNFLCRRLDALPHIRLRKVQPLAVSSAKHASRCPRSRPSGAWLRSRILFWVRFFRAEGNRWPDRNTLRDGLNKAAHSKQFLNTLKKPQSGVAYMDQPEFAAFWAVDAKRQEDAIVAISRITRITSTIAGGQLTRLQFCHLTGPLTLTLRSVMSRAPFRRRRLAGACAERRFADRKLVAAGSGFMPKIVAVLTVFSERCWLRGSKQTVRDGGVGRRQTCRRGRCYNRGSGGDVRMAWFRHHP